MANPIPYQQFLNLGGNSALDTHGGPWHCSTTNVDTCDSFVSTVDVGCMGGPDNCTIIIGYTEAREVPNLSMVLSLALLLDEYPVGTNYLFSWSFYARFQQNTGLRTTIPANFSSSIGDKSFQESPLLPTDPYFSTFMSHNGSLATPSTRIIGVSVTATYPAPAHTTDLMAFVFHRFSLQFSAIPSPSDTPPIEPSSQPKTKNLGAIIGGVVGGLAVIVATILVSWWLLRRKWGKNATTTGGTDATRASVLPATQKSAPQSPSSGLQFPPSDPPSYESTTPLALFAQNYRSLISPQLESKLKAAGYLPHLSPGIISEELWRERYGLSDFELAALKEAHEHHKTRDNGERKIEGDLHSAGAVGSSWRPIVERYTTH